MVLSYCSDFHPELADLCEHLRYFLGGDRPSQTTHQALFPVWYLDSLYLDLEKRKSKKLTYEKMWKIYYS